LLIIKFVTNLVCPLPVVKNGRFDTPKNTSFIPIVSSTKFICEKGYALYGLGKETTVRCIIANELAEPEGGLNCGKNYYVIYSVKN